MALSAVVASCCFFSSRRRHTRCLSDWSSDVCSSDLRNHGLVYVLGPERSFMSIDYEWLLVDFDSGGKVSRSEERRVGKECTPRWQANQNKTVSDCSAEYTHRIASSHGIDFDTDTATM